MLRKNESKCILLSDFLTSLSQIIILQSWFSLADELIRHKIIHGKKITPVQGSPRDYRGGIGGSLQQLMDHHTVPD